MNTQRGRKDRLPPPASSDPSQVMLLAGEPSSGLSCCSVCLTARATTACNTCCQLSAGMNNAVCEPSPSPASMGVVGSHASTMQDHHHQQQQQQQHHQHQHRSQQGYHRSRHSSSWWLVGYRVNATLLALAVTLLPLLSLSSLLPEVSGIRHSVRPFYPVRRAIEIPQHKKMKKKPCSVKGKVGTCMFVWECTRYEGTHLGICTDDYMFGSCCTHDPVFNAIDNNHFSNKEKEPQQSSNFFQSLAILHQKKPFTSVAVSQQVATTTTTASSSSTSPVTSTTSQVTTRRPPYHATTKSPTFSPSQPTSLTTTSSLSSLSTTTTTTTSSSSSSSLPSNKPVSFDDRYIYHYSKPLSVSRPMDDVRTEAPPPAASLSIGMNQVKVMSESTSSVSTPRTTTLQVDFPAATLTEDNLISVSDFPSTTTTTKTTTTSAGTKTTMNNEKPVDPWSRPWTSTTNSSGNRPTYRPPPTKYPPRPWIFRPKPSTSSTAASTTSTTASTTTTSASTTPATSAPVSPTNLAPAVSPLPTTTTTTTSTTTPSPTTTTTSTTTSWPASTPKPALMNGTQPATISARPGSQGRYEECGVPPLYAQGRIVGGRDSAFGQFPWQVSVRRTSFFGFSSTHRCGGALINEQWVATAGHCVEDLLPSQIRIRVGEYDFSNVLEVHPFQERTVSKKVVHPKYNFFTYEYDLALIKLEKPVDPMPHVVPICLPGSDDLLIGENATVTGWGRLSEGGTLPSILQHVQVPIVSNEKCKEMFMSSGRHEYIPDIFLCAGYQKGGRDSCQGDSGGPLQVKGKDGRMFLAGIISWGIGCAEPNMPGVCTRISKFRDWIVENVT